MINNSRHTIVGANFQKFWFELIPSSKVDWGVCPPGTSPGGVGEAVLVVNGDFTGCPFVCPTGTYGPGGETNALRELVTACAIGCAGCPAGAVCPSTGLEAPVYCEPGHYNADSGSQTQSGCRACERRAPSSPLALTRSSHPDARFPRRACMTQLDAAPALSCESRVGW